LSEVEVEFVRLWYCSRYQRRNHLWQRGLEEQ